MENQTISVIMGIYNCADTLPAAIDSILAQTYTDWQLIMCDDCSADATYAVAQDYVRQYPNKMILLRNEKNMRLSYSLNHCLRHATGTYVARMDGDDLSKPERFAQQLAFLKAHPEFDLVGSAMQRFNDDGLSNVEYAVDHPDYYTLRRRIPYNHATILTYKRVYDALGGYTVSERTNRAQDYDLWFRFYKQGFRGDNLRDPLYLVREDANAIRRRTFHVRWNAFKTTRFGFRLLGYPRRWLIRPALAMLCKSITPFFIVDLVRKHQAQSKKKQETA